MKKKSVVFCFVIVLLLISTINLALAQQTEEEKVAKAYDWLIDKVRGHWTDLNNKQHAFSLLALSCNGTLANSGQSALNSKAYVGPEIKCWGVSKVTSESQCLLTETALAKMALDEFDENTTKVKNWLLRQNMTQTQGIDWYLQVDVERGHNATCSVIYAEHDEKLVFKVNDDKTVEMLNTSECFKRTYRNYWFEIEKSADCYSNVYTIKCWSDAEIYRVSLLYKKTGSEVWYVSSETKSGKPGVPGSNQIEDQPQPLELRVPSYCLANPLESNCDYEGSAWTAYVLSRRGDVENANLFIPYLVVFADDSVKWFPESFLYPLTSQTRHSDTILNAQKIVGLDKGYWLIQPIKYGRVYDTAHAGLALGTTGQDAITKAKNYLLANQENNGDLVSSAYGEAGKNSIRDTAFALWVFWPYLCPGVGGPSDCESLEGHFCKSNCTPDEIEIPTLECPLDLVCCKMVGIGPGCTEAGGTCKSECDTDEFDIWTVICPDWEDYCCKKYADAECEETGGSLCESGYECDDDTVYTLDGDCCLGSCIPTNASEQNCIDIGIECEFGEVCVNSLTWNLISFTTTQDTDMCCVGTTVECVQDVSCSSIGEECGTGEDCLDGTIEKTKDSEACCTGRCVGTCARQGGTICTGDEKCTVSYIEASDTTKCCPSQGECKKPASLWWLWLILILIAITGILLYFFKFRKPKPKKKPELFPSGMPPRRPVMPSRPAVRPVVRQAARPIARGAPRPIARVPKIPTPIMPKSKTKRKGKTESELEKTLKRLKKMSKK